MPRHPPNALKTLDHSHCQYPSTYPSQCYQQKDQLLEIYPVAAVRLTNHNARLEQALATLTKSQSEHIFSSLFHTEQANLSKSQARKLVSFLC